MNSIEIPCFADQTRLEMIVFKADKRVERLIMDEQKVCYL